MDPITKAFIAHMEEFAKQEKVPIVAFAKGQRKDDVAAEYRKKFTGREGVLFIGKAQEKTPVFRTERRRNQQSGATYGVKVRGYNRGRWGSRIRGSYAVADLGHRPSGRAPLWSGAGAVGIRVHDLQRAPFV